MAASRDADDWEGWRIVYPVYREDTGVVSVHILYLSKVARMVDAGLMAVHANRDRGVPLGTVETFEHIVETASAGDPWWSLEFTIDVFFLDDNRCKVAFSKWFDYARDEQGRLYLSRTPDDLVIVTITRYASASGPDRCSVAVEFVSSTCHVDPDTREIVLPKIFLLQQAIGTTAPSVALLRRLEREYHDKIMVDAEPPVDALEYYQM